jgi:GMP synthase-like glutamine amidotransferase
MRALHLHHDANSLPGLIGEVLEERGYDTAVHQVCEIAGSPIGGTEFPDPQAYDLVVVYGSRWSVYEDDVSHWVIPELDFLRLADTLGVPVLGLCFGAQLLSAAHGGLVAAADRPEIGWHRVQSHQPEIEPGPWLQWHFDTFTVPAGAEELAESPSGPQAFRLRRNLGLQFHPEADRAVIESWYEDDIDQIQAFELDPEDLLAEADRQRPAARARADRLITTFLV